MTVHKLSAGDGYTYLTRQVASADRHLDRGQDLTDYYVVDGNPPGVWLGAGAVVLGVSGQVDEKQMKALFGEGRHPDADAVEAAALARGASVGEAMEASKLGRAFPQFKAVEDDGWRTAISGAYAQFRADTGRDPSPGVERDLIRWNVAGQLLGGDATDVARQVFLAGRGRAQKQAVAGFDCVFTPVKSVSVLWALGDAGIHEIVRQAHEAAWRQSMGWVEREAALTRVGAGGIAQVDTTGLVAVAFEHHDSRAGDPNLHTHVAIANKVQGLDGVWRSLDARVLHSLAVAASERYNSLIESELVERLGVVFEDVTRGRGKEPVREVVGVDARLLKAFSSRRASIEVAYKELLGDYRSAHGHEPDRATQLKLMQQATLDTREAKGALVRLSAQRAAWREQAVEVLGDQEAIDAMVAQVLTPAVTERTGLVVVGDRSVDVTGLGLDELGDLAVQIVAERRSTWTRWNVESEAQRLARIKVGVCPQDGTCSDLAEAIAQRAVGRSMVRIQAPNLNPVPFVMCRRSGGSIYRVHGGTRFTSRAILHAEEDLLQAARLEGGLRVTVEDLDRAVSQVEEETGRELNAGQRGLAERFAAGGHLVEVGIGPAGSGKTSAMRGFVRAVTGAGGRVLALGPSSVAAAVLGDELGVQGDTVHKLMHAHACADEDNPVAERYRVDERTVLLVDEAGMAGTPLLQRLLDLARRNGAAVRLLGDPAQLSAVEAGGALRLIANRVGAAELSEVHRFLRPGDGPGFTGAAGVPDTAQAKASLALRRGDHAGLDYYVARGRVRAGSRDGLLEEIYANWATDRAEGHQSLMIAGSNADVAALNVRARTDLVAAAVVVAEGVGLHDGTTAGIGDQIVTRTNDRRLLPDGDHRGDWVRNGDIWTVRDVFDDGSMRVQNARAGHVVDLPAEYLKENVELAYAATIHRVQGMTVDRAHFLVEPGTTRAQLYVAATRARFENHLYAAGEQLVDLDADHKPDPGRAARDLLESVLDHDDVELSATETIQETLEASAALSTLVPEYVDAFTRVLDPDRAARMADLVDQAVGAINPELRSDLLADPAWPALAARLAEHEDRGADLTELLTGAITSRELDTAESLAEVLHWRVGPATDPAAATTTDLPPWITPPPAPEPEPDLEVPAVVAADPEPDVTVPGPGEPDQPEPLPDVEQAAADVADPRRARAKEVMAKAWAWWTEQATGPQSWTGEYLAGRGLDDLQAGFAPAGWDNLLLNHLRGHGVTEPELIETGLAVRTRRGTLVDRFRDRLVIAIRDTSGDVIAVTARKNPADTSDDVPKYLNSPETLLYKKREVLAGLGPDAVAALGRGARPVLVEGPMDAAAITTLGADVVPLSACGTAVTGDHLDLLREICPNGLDDLVFALDGDTAGKAATLRLAGMVTPREAGKIHVLPLPEGDDPADLVEHGRADHLAQALSAPVPLSHAMVDAALSRWDIDSGHVEPKVHALRQAAALIGALDPGPFADGAAWLTARMGDRLSRDTITDVLLDAHLSRHQPAPTPEPVVPAAAEDTDAAPDVRAGSTRRPEVRDWLDRQAELIRQRIDHLVDEAVTGQPAWVAVAGPCPTHDDRAATRWTQAARTVVAYRDQYAVAGPEPLGDGPGQGTRAQHRAVAAKALDTLTTASQAPVPDVERALRRTTTAKRVDDLLRRAQQAERTATLESLAERVRRLHEDDRPPTRRPDDPTRKPDRSGPQM